MAVASPAIEILRCPSCAGAVPFGDIDPATCPFCGTAVPIPPAHQKLREATHLDADARRRGEARLGKLAMPPGTIASYLGREDVSWIVLIFIGVFVVASYIVAFILDGIVHLFSPNHSELWWAWFDSIFAFASLVTFVLIGSFGRRNSVGRERLRATLAARPPERPGGPALCRSCGAPLYLQAGVLGTRCPYCKTDNVVVPQAGDAEAKRRDRVQVHRAMAFADDIEQQNRRQLRSSLIARSLLLCVPGLAYFIEPIKMMPSSGSSSSELYRVQNGEYLKLVAIEHKDCMELENRWLETGDRALVDNVEDNPPVVISVWKQSDDGHKSWPLRVWIQPPGSEIELIAPSSGSYAFCQHGAYPTHVDVTFERAK